MSNPAPVNVDVAAPDVASNDERHLLERVEFRTVIEDAPVMLWLTDADGRMIFTNMRWKDFIGTERYSAHGDDAWLEALHPDDKRVVFADFESAFKGRQAFQMEYRLKRADGEWRYVLDTGEPYHTNEGRFAGFIGSSTDITEHKRFEEELKRSHTDLTRHNREMGWINQLNSYLQACRTLHETYPVIQHFGRLVFPSCPGTLYLFNETKLLLENVVTWGTRDSEDPVVLSPDDCWGLRQGKMHAVDQSNRALGCRHVGGESTNSYVCVPVVAQGEMVGMLHLLRPDPERTESDDEYPAADSAWLQLVSVTADNLGLAIVSLKLREALEAQSVRDPLTGLYNRRHMEESLSRECSRAQRTGAPLSVMMIDLDHFKGLNDEYGHEAGDTVLREVAEVFTDALRNSDVACRYGGEEFVLILPDAGPAQVLQKAESIRQRISEKSFLFHNHTLSGVTVSIGVAAAGTELTKGSEMLRSADRALYEAKRDGRNRVVVAE